MVLRKLQGCLPQDNKNDMCGRLKERNALIACLLAGIYDKSHAATILYVSTVRGTKCFNRSSFMVFQCAHDSGV